MGKGFIRDEQGMALTEYLVLLGLLVGGVITATSMFGAQLGQTYGGWAGFIQTLSRAEPEVAATSVVPDATVEADKTEEVTDAGKTEESTVAATETGRSCNPTAEEKSDGKANCDHEKQPKKP